ncbi:hypothetical protein [Baekduia sp.]|uniref:hypothetical protein n=1 Tax=Baekduia sp. TaxID=2600305 RepID=UPI002E04E462|nr:hypothetical protein [Baekduia sp.]
MLKAVRSEGGFGQRAAVLNKDTRYLGEVPLQALVVPFATRRPDVRPVRKTAGFRPLRRYYG